MLQNFILVNLTKIGGFNRLLFPQNVISLHINCVESRRDFYYVTQDKVTQSY